VKLPSQAPPPGSIDISIDGIGVSCPITAAAIWSTEVPTRAISPLNGCAPVRNTAAAREWFSAPPVSSPLSGATCLWARLLMTLML
jgi:hypothetical protein